MRNITYRYVFHRRRAKLRPESVLMPFISCKGNCKYETLLQSPATSPPSPRHSSPEIGMPPAPGVLRRGGRWVAAPPVLEAHHCSLIHSQKEQKFLLLLSFLLCDCCRALPLQMTSYPTQLRLAQVTSGALGWDRRRKKVTKLCSTALGEESWSRYSSCLFSEFSEPASYPSRVGRAVPAPKGMI